MARNNSISIHLAFLVFLLSLPLYQTVTTPEKDQSLKPRLLASTPNEICQTAMPSEDQIATEITLSDYYDSITRSTEYTLTQVK